MAHMLTNEYGPRRFTVPIVRAAPPHRRIPPKWHPTTACLSASVPSEGAQAKLYWYSSFFTPNKPEAGGKQKYNIYITNALNTVIPKATYVLKVSYKVGDAVGWTTTRNYVDSGCQVDPQSYVGYQRTRQVEVVAKGTVYTSVDTVFRAPEYYPYGELEFPSSLRFMTPGYPPAGSKFSAKITVINLALTPLDAGASLEVWADLPAGSPASPTCGTKGDVSIPLPKLGPGKSKAIEVAGLTAPNQAQASVTAVVFAAGCKTGDASLSERAYGYQPVSKAVPVFMGSGNIKNQYTFKLRTTPAKPKANSTMTVKFKVLNAGTVEGPVGKVAIWTSPPVDSFGGFVAGPPCSPEGFVALADFGDVRVQPGKTASLKVENVPVPAAPGFWAVTAKADAACGGGADALLLVYNVPAYAVVEVV
ncbi:hypothetical protein Rsub_03565 [Raphidocelis subcapitata]|uniref:CARDB domain-containing protein n=1 Tax=Raphidocelis subcapitata TaxID=307507 RepID=A0A2V0P2D7_9CHLO|nr:hypothetical protein Rsub_03565 [Raphidocelis subcapitata]|eukprot:GBF91245.1 hypothetical protein Rsub_03565 [Raphidocelis subcapitata]